MINMIPTRKNELVFAVDGKVRAKLLCHSKAPSFIKDQKMAGFIRDYDPFISRYNGNAIKELHPEYK